MHPFKHSLGLFAVLGNWPEWEGYFDLSRRGLKVSFVVLLASLMPLWLVAYGIETERAIRLDGDMTQIAIAPFAIIMGLLARPSIRRSERHSLRGLSWATPRRYSTNAKGSGI